jgi:hypothetical protein
MRIITTAIMTLCAVVYGFAQTASPSPENWPKMAAEEFRVEVPITPALFEHPKKRMGRTYAGDVKGTYFRIFSEKRLEAYSIKKGLEFIRGFEKKGSAVAFGQIKAEKFDFEDNEKLFHRAIYLETSSRAYLFHTISENGDDNVAKRFFRTLQIAGRRVSGAGTDYDATPPAVQTGGTTPAKGTGSGQEEGIWPAHRESVAGGTRPSTTAPADTAQNVRILSKPRAAYTDLARTYYISGTVAIRIAFRDNGEIGAVTPITRLPFGVTGQAIAAAKAITFEPARKNGVPVTKMMTIQYGFTIY